MESHNPFFKPKLKPRYFLLNRPPVDGKCCIDVAASRGSLVYEQFYNPEGLAATRACDSEDDCCQNGAVPATCHPTAGYCSK